MLDISNFPWASCGMKENRIMFQGDSLALKRTKLNTKVHRYEFELVTIDMEMKNGRAVMAKLSAAAADTLVFVHPRLSYAEGVEPTQGIVTTQAGQAGSKEVLIGGFGESWSLLAGDYIQFEDHTKVYQVAEDTPFQTGSQTVKLNTSLTKDVSVGTKIIMNDVKWFLESNGAIETNMEASDNQDMEITLIAVERL